MIRLGRNAKGQFIDGHPFGKRFSAMYLPPRRAKGSIPWNKGLKTGFIPWNKGRPGYSTSLKGRSRPEFLGSGNPCWRGGLPNCSRCGTQLCRKDNKTGICKKCQHENSQLRVHTSNEYVAWRKAVFARDGYTCQTCGKSGCYIEADHIKPWSLYPALRLELSNGRTLCRACHEATDTYGWKLYHSLVGV